MAQWFTGQTAFRRPQFGSSNPCLRFTVTCNSSSRDPLPSDGLCGHRTDLRADTYIHTEFNAKHKMEIQKNEGWRESLLRGLLEAADQLPFFGLARFPWLCHVTERTRRRQSAFSSFCPGDTAGWLPWAQGSAVNYAVSLHGSCLCAGSLNQWLALAWLWGRTQQSLLLTC